MKKLPINQIICGDTLTELRKMPDESISCCISSPPYWALRAYSTNPQIWGGEKDCKHRWDTHSRYWDNRAASLLAAGEGHDFAGKKDARGQLETQFCCLCGAWCGELGLEPTFELYIEHLCTIYDEVKRVLRKDGTCWVNLGDTYGGKTGEPNAPKINPAQLLQYKSAAHVKAELPAKCLCLIPDRFRIAMVERGWIIRNKINWVKPNPMPSSAKDRFTVDFEDVIFFIKNNRTLYWVRPDGKMVDKQPNHKTGKEGLDWEWGIRKRKKVKLSLWDGMNYFFEPQYEPHAKETDNRYKYPMMTGKKEQSGAGRPDLASNTGGMKNLNPLGRNKRTTWTIPTQAFSEAHFATFPEKLVEPMIKSGCPRYICKKCGQPRKKMYKPAVPYKAGQTYQGKHAETDKQAPGRRIQQNMRALRELTGHHDDIFEMKFKGYTDCGCGAEFVPGVVLDPFLGSGTTCLVSKKFHLWYMGIELSKKYCKMAERRLRTLRSSLFEVKPEEIKLKKSKKLPKLI